MIQIDARGLGCPLPVVKTMQALQDHPGEPITVVVDGEVAKENLLRLAQKSKLAVTLSETTEGEYQLILSPEK